MNWFLLVVSGCIELVFTFCLSKVSKTAGLEKGLWCIGKCHCLESVPCDEGSEDFAYRHGLCRLDGHRCRRHGSHGHPLF